MPERQRTRNLLGIRHEMFWSADHGCWCQRTPRPNLAAGRQLVRSLHGRGAKGSGIREQDFQAKRQGRGEEKGMGQEAKAMTEPCLFWPSDGLFRRPRDCGL